MAKVDVLSLTGAAAGSVELDDHTFGIQPNVAVMHQVVTAQLAARRSGTQSTRTRAESRGGGAKPWAQKGTGRARHGSIRSPQWRGGGVALGPKPRSYAQKTPRKMIRLALRSALSDRAAEGRVVVVDAWNFDVPKTKDAVAALAAVGVQGRALVVAERGDQRQSGSAGGGGRMGLEYFEARTPEAIGAEAARVAVAMLDARQTINRVFTRPQPQPGSQAWLQSR